MAVYQVHRKSLTRLLHRCQDRDLKASTITVSAHGRIAGQADGADAGGLAVAAVWKKAIRE